MDPSRIKISFSSTTNRSAQTIYKTICQILSEDHGIQSRYIYHDIIREPASSIRDHLIFIDLDTIDIMWNSTLRAKLIEVSMNNKLVFSRDLDRELEIRKMPTDIKDIISYFISDDPYVADPRYFFVYNPVFNYIDYDGVNRLKHLNDDPGFFCMMNLQRPHRNQTILELDRFDLIKTNHVIYHRCPFDIPGLQKQKLYQDVSDVGSTQQFNPGKIVPIYDKFCLELIVETTLDYVFVTEKTTRPLLAGMPSIWIASRGFLSYLRSLGLRTYDRYWNEDYDMIADESTRIRSAVSLLSDLVSDPDEMVKIYADSRDIHAHNVEVIYTIASNQDELLKNDLKNMLEVI